VQAFASADHIHHAAYGWRASFWLCAAIGLVAGLVWFIARGTLRKNRFSLAHGNSHSSVRAGGRERSAGPEAAPWGTVLRSKEVLAISLSYFSFGYVAWIFFSWFYIYLAQVRG